MNLEKSDINPLSPSQLNAPTLPPVKIGLLGNVGVGKSSLLLRYVGGQFQDIPATIYLDQKKKRSQYQGHAYDVQIIDTAGHERFHTIYRTYYQSLQGVILVYDVSQKDSFEALNFWLQEVESNCINGVKILIVGNKSDLFEQQQISFEEGLAFTKALGFKFLQVSAKSGSNVPLAFEMLTQNILSDSLRLLRRSFGEKLTVSKSRSAFSSRSQSFSSMDYRKSGLNIQMQMFPMKKGKQRPAYEEEEQPCCVLI